MAKVVDPELIEHYRKRYPNGRPFLYPDESDDAPEANMQSWTEIDDGIYVASQRPIDHPLITNWGQGSAVYLTAQQMIFYHQSYKNGDKVEKLVLLA